MRAGHKHIISDWTWLYNDVISLILRHSMAVLHYGISTLLSERQHPCCWRLQSTAHFLKKHPTHWRIRIFRIFFYLGFLENALQLVTHSLCFVQHLCYAKSSKTVTAPWHCAVTTVGQAVPCSRLLSTTVMVQMNPDVLSWTEEHWQLWDEHMQLASTCHAEHSQPSFITLSYPLINKKATKDRLITRERTL